MKLSEIVNKTANVVYHCTKYEGAMSIMTHDYFRSTKGKILTGLSTTTDKNYFWGSSEVRFVLDLGMLRKDYKVEETDEKIPVKGEPTLDESELVVISDGAITEAHKYIIEIQYTPIKADFKEMQDKFMSKIKAYCEKYHIKYSVLR